MRYKFIGGSLGKGEKKPRKKIDMSEGQCDLEKIIMLILTLTGKKKEQKKKKDKNLLLTKQTTKKNYKNSDIPHCSHNCNKTNLLLTKKTRKKNYKNSDIPHCSHNCNKTNQHIVILLENLCSLKFFHVLQDSFKVPHLMDQGYKVNTSANYIHAYNESRFFYHKTSKCY